VLSERERATAARFWPLGGFAAELSVLGSDAPSRPCRGRAVLAVALLQRVDRPHRLLVPLFPAPAYQLV